jgi:hypothetical protein
MKTILGQFSRIKKFSSLLILVCATLQSTLAQDTAPLTGSFRATESWSVTLYRGANNVATRLTGRATGTLVVNDGVYSQINETGAASLGGLKISRSIGYDNNIYDFNYGGYEIDGDYPCSALAGGPGGFYAVVQLTFFVIKIPLGSQADVPSPYPFDSSDFIATGSSLASFSGAGSMVDENSGFGPVGPSYFINEVDASSTSSLIPVAAPGTVAPRITTQPQSQTVLLGDSLVFSVSASGTDPLSFQWEHDGTNLFDDGEFSGSATSSLTISDAEVADAGAFSVVISNERGSATSAKAVLSIGALVSVQTTQGGKVTQNYDGETLIVGKKYTMTAAPAAGYLFAGWSGSVTTNTLALTFNLQGNLDELASFVPNPFIAEHGTFDGLFMDPDDVTEAGSGFFTLSLTTTGSFTGKIMTSGGAYSLPTTTKFDVKGRSEFAVKTKQATLTFNLQLDVDDPANEQITGTVFDGTSTAELTADRAVFSAVANKAVNYEGRYTLAIAGSDDGASSPGGFGCATLSISSAGLIAIAGSLADGTAMSQSVSVSKDGRWPFYTSYAVPPAGNGGSVFGWLTFSNQPASALGGNVYWFRPAGKTPTVYQSGFSNSVPVIGSAYNPAEKPLLALTSGQVTLDSGNLRPPITNQIALSSSDIITVPKTTENTNKLTLTINKTTGAITGSFANPSNPKQTVKINGVLLQNQTNAVGYFIGTNQSGAFLLANP